MEYKSVFFGPFLGELGWLLSRWQGYCRYWKEKEYIDQKVYVASFPGTEIIFTDFADHFLPLPTWFLDLRLDVDSYESIGITSKIYADLILYFRQFYDLSTTKEIRTPRGFSFILPQTSSQKVIKLTGSLTAQQERDKLLNGRDLYIVISARGRVRGIERNWPESSWNILVDAILDYYPDLTVVITGAPSGSSLLLKQGPRIINTIHTGSIDLSLAFLEKAICSITSQSGSTHLSLQTACPSVIIGHEKQRHAITENYLSTPVLFIESPNYQVPSSFVFEHFQKLYQAFLEKREKI